MGEPVLSDFNFDERIEQLSAEIGQGKLEMLVEVDQVYAAPQERGFWETGPNAGVRIRNHPGGGQTHALRDSLYVPINEHMATLTRAVLTEDGSRLHHGAVEVADDIADEYAERAPVEVGDLRASASPSVIDDGVTTYHRPPTIPRLSRAALRAKAQANLDELYPGGLRHPNDPTVTK